MCVFACKASQIARDPICKSTCVRDRCQRIASLKKAKNDLRQQLQTEQIQHRKIAKQTEAVAAKRKDELYAELQEPMI